MVCVVTHQLGDPRWLLSTIALLLHDSLGHYLAASLLRVCGTLPRVAATLWRVRATRGRVVSTLWRVVATLWRVGVAHGRVIGAAPKARVAAGKGNAIRGSVPSSGVNRSLAGEP